MLFCELFVAWQLKSRRTFPAMKSRSGVCWLAKRFFDSLSTGFPAFRMKYPKVFPLIIINNIFVLRSNLLRMVMIREDKKIVSGRNFFTENNSATTSLGLCHYAVVVSIIDRNFFRKRTDLHGPQTGVRERRIGEY